ncbi:hypothetical protein L9F63_019582, partial [Diploptera punctata]
WRKKKRKTKTEMDGWNRGGHSKTRSQPGLIKGCWHSLTTPLKYQSKCWCERKEKFCSEPNITPLNFYFIQQLYFCGYSMPPVNIRAENKSPPMLVDTRHDLKDFRSSFSRGLKFPDVSPETASGILK